MLRTAVEEQLRDERAAEGGLFLACGDYCFGSVPDTIRSRLDADVRRPLPDDVFEGVRTDGSNVVTVVVDGYGLDSWKRDRHNHAFLVRLFTRAAALDRDLFGNRAVSDRFRRRCGDLVLTHRDVGVWWGDVEPGELDLMGMHGGLHPSEMLVPFAAVRADRL